MTVAALFLDLDNTLIDTEASMRESLVSAFSAELASPLPADVADRVWDIWTSDPSGWYKRYEAGELSASDQRRRRFLDVTSELSLAVNDFESWQRSYIDGVVAASRPFDGTLAFLRQVSDLPLAVVTNVETSIQEAKIATAGLSSLLPNVFGTDLAPAKPDPSLFKLACTRLDVSPSDVVHVGDSWDADVVGALNAGMRAVWLDREDVDPGRELPEGVKRVTSLSEIPAQIAV